MADYDTWKAVFDEHASIRRDHGATGHRVLRDGNDLLVLVEFPDAEAARSFVTDPALLAAQRIGGVQGTPDSGRCVEAEQVRY